MEKLLEGGLRGPLCITVVGRAVRLVRDGHSALLEVSHGKNARLAFMRDSVAFEAGEGLLDLDLGPFLYCEPFAD